MRHRKSFNHLGRKPAHRKAMLSNMATSLILKKRITTTTAKAKALRSYVEPLLTKSKDDTTHSRRVVFSYLKDKNAVTELFREISPKIADRPGGYTRILKIGNRPGDNAELAIIELVDYNENMLSQKPAKTTSKRRRRGGTAKTEDSAAVVETVVEEEVKVEKAPEAVAEEVVSEAEVVEETIEAAVVEEAVAEEVVSEAEEVKETPSEDVVEEVKAEDVKEETEAKSEEEDKKGEDK